MAVDAKKGKKPGKGGRKPGKFVKKTGKSDKHSKTGPKKRITPTMKQKAARTDKIIKADQVQWKPVEIPDNLGDYSGFFGLEELEGVDVRMVNGKAEFITKESDLENDMDVDQQESEQESESDEEFTGFGDDDNVAETEEKSEKTASSVKKNEKNERKKEKKAAQLEDKKAKAKDAKEKKASEDDKAEVELEEALVAQAFSALDMPLPDEKDINLPQWDQFSLNPYTLCGLQELGFKSPTPIQKETIPVAIDGKDVVGKATTGSGKTLAYGIPILEKYLLKIEEIAANRKATIISPPSGIIFAPTRELAHQVVDHLNKIAKFSPLSTFGIVSITGGLSMQRQERLLSYGPGIVVATPGRFLDLIGKDEKLVKRMAATDIIVLDEADRLLQDGHFEEFEKILELLEKNRSKKDYGWKWQTLVFSATFSKDLFSKLDKNPKRKDNKDQGLVGNEEILELLAKKIKFKDSKPTLCDANPKEIVSGQITEALVECGPTERDLYIYYFVLTYPGSTLVFANSVESVRRLAPMLENLNIPAFSIHSGMIQKQRLRALERFKKSSQKNKSSVLIATDVAARGLDIPNIDHVAHYHLPRSADIYIHRSGRTARAGKEGVSVMFCSPQEASGPLKKLRKVVASAAGKENFNARDVKLLPIDNDIVSQIRERIQLASKLADSSIAKTATRKEDSWLRQAADDLGIENLSDIEDFEDDVIKTQRKRKEKKLLGADEQKALRYQLKQMLAVPLRKNHRRSYITSGLENLAHQIVSGATSETILGRKLVKALDELRVPKKSKVSKKKKLT